MCVCVWGGGLQKGKSAVDVASFQRFLRYQIIMSGAKIVLLPNIEYKIIGNAKQIWLPRSKYQKYTQSQSSQSNLQNEKTDTQTNRQAEPLSLKWNTQSISLSQKVSIQSWSHVPRNPSNAAQHTCINASTQSTRETASS